MTMYDEMTMEEQELFNNNLGSLNEIIAYGNAKGWNAYEDMNVWAKRYFAEKEATQ